MSGNCPIRIGCQEVLIHLRVRRFLLPQRCVRQKDLRRAGAGLTVRYGRWSVVAGEALRAIALALGGRAGARLAERLVAAVSRMTLIRLIRALPDPVVEAGPAVLGWVTSPCAAVASTGRF